MKAWLIKPPLWLLLILLAVLAWFRLHDVSPARQSPRFTSDIPDFSQYQDIVEKKKAFFGFLRPLVDAANARVLADRQRLKRLLNEDHVSQAEQHWMQNLAADYDVAWPLGDDGRTMLLRRVDMLPPELVLAQAANESAWGTSRFAIRGNNFFGQWCYVKGCGLVPRARDDGASHEVARFSSPQASVRSYIHNINTNGAYLELRLLRAKARQQGEKPQAKQLVQGLDRYSERGQAYVDELLQMIRHNRRYMQG